MDSVNSTSNIPPPLQPCAVLVCKSRFGRVLFHGNDGRDEETPNHAGDLLPKESAMVLEVQVTANDTVDTRSVKVVSVRGEIGWTTAYQAPQNGKWAWTL